ncbi:MAG: hypothetical protein MUC92_06055 [Fimbriimonadaceae bacterium]|jgi:hypothetical protein|nr:hypothetical protein [Fimbriimonadaceae bacterium]
MRISSVQNLRMISDNEVSVQSYQDARHYLGLSRKITRRQQAIFANALSGRSKTVPFNTGMVVVAKRMRQAALSWSLLHSHSS